MINGYAMMCARCMHEYTAIGQFVQLVQSVQSFGCHWRPMTQRSGSVCRWSSSSSRYGSSGAAMYTLFASNCLVNRYFILHSERISRAYTDPVFLAFNQRKPSRLQFSCGHGISILRPNKTQE